MGKRKFGAEKERTAKKPKSEENSDKNTIEDGETEVGKEVKNQMEKSSNRHGFDIKHFRKELAAKQGQTMVLTQFLQVCLNPDNEVDYLLEYLKVGGNSHEILRQVTQDNKKNLTLATPAFHLFHLIIMKVQSSLPHMISVTEEACRYFLNTFMTTVEIMISENSGPRHRKVILKLLTSMVTLNPDLGVEVLNQAPLTPKHLQYILEKTNYKETDNVRTCFVLFMTSFLIDGHLPLIKALLEKQGLLSLVIPGLLHDESQAVIMFLNILKKNVIDNSLISKTLKLKTFNHQVLHNLFKLFSWKGPPGSNETKNESRSDIVQLLSEILLTLFTSNKLGLYFTDSSLGTGDTNKNQNLYKALLSLKRPWENDKECEVILEIVHKCPDLHRAITSIIEHSFEPQHSPIWERTIDFVIKLGDRLKPEEIVPRMANLTPAQVANFVRFITLPIPLLKYIQHNLDKDQTISLYCIKVLVKMMQSVKRYIQILDANETQNVAELKNKLEYFIPKHLPTPSVIVSLIKNITDGNKKEHTDSNHDYKLPTISDTEALIFLADILLLYNDIQPAFFETLDGTIDMKKLLDYSSTLTEGHVSLLKFKIVSLWLALDSSAISLKNPMFKDLFLIMLEVYTTEDDHTWIEAKDTLHKFFKNTSIFEADEDEIHLMLYTLRNSKVNPSSLIGDIVEYVLSNSKDLSEYVRNQIVHFEISDENSEACLDKLFTDLMENKSTQDSVFLENKVPSPFIVGCMQFIQSNKEAKKSLKQFLSLYISNLLHWNYSPELTEVLIGDSKLDIRSYVGGWISQPVSIPDNITAKDETLKNISKSIINNEEIALEKVFPCLVYFNEIEKEISDFITNGVPYKINVSNNIDSSELLIWAKYLVFCTIRLTNMNRLKEEQQKKISDYFECIIAIAKKHHMSDASRTIVLSLLKNPHFLKIYRPLDLQKEGTSILATKFILQVITLHEDIVKNLDLKHKTLKSYQQKNYNEILKAFIKINKRKNLDTSHTIEVLKTIGLSKEDDLRVFNQIFGAEISTCVKDDKEPSFVLELLRILIEKYSQTVTLELQPGVLKKTLKLYTDLLVSKDIAVNLTNLETVLTIYFENKSHHALNVPEDVFKKFFEANVTRKSAAQLATVLLKYNVKFCNVLKDQVTKPEILGLRELTLPLGTALIDHNQFLLANKELLSTIYSEYKSNIAKMLEKPHKAGQIYILCWKFIRKLVIECMEIEECQKLFTKIHKFETIETSHIHVFEAAFLRICILENGQKKEHLLNYLLSMLNLLTNALKESKDSEIIKEIAENIQTAVKISAEVVGFDTESKQDVNKVTESAIWQNFCKTVLKDSLKVKTADQNTSFGPQILHLLSELVQLLYPTDHEDIPTLFDMVTSHSEFLNVMLSHHSTEIKSRLVEFLFTLIQTNKSVMKTQQIPVYLSAYHATRKPCDRLILSILHFYENNDQPINEYKPYIFGDSAANHYAVRKNKTSSLWAHPTANQVLNLFEKDIIDRTVKHFPVTQKLDYHYDLPDLKVKPSNKLEELTKDGLFKPITIKDNEGAINKVVTKTKHAERIRKIQFSDMTTTSHLDEDDGIYDPVFLFPLLSHLLAPGSVASCFKLLRVGLLSVPVMALSSHCPLMRAAAYHVLHRFCLLLDTETKHKNDKLFLTDFINTLKRSLSTAIVNDSNTDGKNPRLPAVDALYLAKALMVSTAPFDPLYKPVNNFFIAKQTVDLTVVPDFLSLFHDSEVESAERRAWILQIIRDGTKTMSDVNVVFKTMCLKMIMDFSISVLCDKRMLEKVLGVINSIVAIPRAFEIIVEGYGLIPWLHALVRQIGRDEKIVKKVFHVIENMLQSLKINSLARNINSCAKNGKKFEEIEIKVNKDIENEILIILYDLLPLIEPTVSENLTSYVKIYTQISKRSTKLLTKNQMLNLLSKCAKESEQISILKKSVTKNDHTVLWSKNLESEDDIVKLLSILVKNFLM